MTAFAVAKPALEIIDGHVTTTSLQIAEHFDKRHDTVLRAITRLECSQEFTARNFAASEYTDSTGRKLRCYRITRDGFVFLAMGFTGKDAAQWKEAYIDAFNQMEAALLAPSQSLTITAAQQQHLKELVDLVAESGKQTHAETWARFHRKFSIPRYTELPAAQFDAACQYLLGKLDQPAIAALIQKHLPGQTPALPLTGQATQAAYQAAHQYIDDVRANPHSHTSSIPVQVLQGVLADALMSQRFLLSVHPSHGLQVQAVPKDACVLPSGQWASAIECNDVYLAPEKLAHLHAVVSAKISSGYLYMHRQRKGQPPALT